MTVGSEYGSRRECARKYLEGVGSCSVKGNPQVKKGGKGLGTRDRKASLMLQGNVCKAKPPETSPATGEKIAKEEVSPHASEPKKSAPTA